jgi:riboflavin kinase/FMN adenylyltransferase
MRIVTQFEALAEVAPVAMAVGMFDGVHRGHQILLKTAKDCAGQHGGDPWVLSFDSHPLRVLDPESAPRMLCTTGQKLDLFAGAGMEGCLLLTFTQEFSMMPAEVFLRAWVEAVPSLRAVVAGENWRFGHRARGDVRLLKAVAPELGFEALVPTPVMWRDVPISSTRIREAIRLANLSEARSMLGRWPSLRAPVIHGLKRGRKLGFPTANLDVGEALIPPDGIYAGRASLEGKTYPAAVYIPRDEREHPASVEVHILDLSDDLYGREITVELIERIRPDDRRFAEDRELVEQIAGDIEQVRRVLTHLAPTGSES